MGGMRALEWAVALPERVETLFFFASGAVVQEDGRYAVTSCLDQHAATLLA
jgi:homoserine acetyltransferase